MSEALSIQNLAVSYDGKPALRNIDVHIEHGKLVGVIGPNGAGKSTLMKASLGLVPKDRGQVRMDGRPIRTMRQHVAYVPQRNDIDWDFPITVFDTVLLGTYPKLGLFHRPKKRDRARAYECLQRVGLENYAKRQIGQLSGGQQQRVFLARALAQDAQLFFLDEPFVGIDASSEETMIRILQALRDQGDTIVVVHHDLSKAEQYFDDLVLIHVDLVASGDVGTVLKPENLTKAYQAQLPFLQKAGVGV